MHKLYSYRVIELRVGGLCATIATVHHYNWNADTADLADERRFSYGPAPLSFAGIGIIKKREDYSPRFISKP